METDFLPIAEVLNRMVDSSVVAEGNASYQSADSDPRGFKDLTVWQVGMDLVAECYRLTSSFPSQEMSGLTRQLRRAAVSVTLNIAEGWGRNGKAEFARFADIARGSLHEVDAAIEVAIRLKFIEQKDAESAVSSINRISAMLLRLTQSLRMKK